MRRFARIICEVIWRRGLYPSTGAAACTVPAPPSPIAKSSTSAHVFLTKTGRAIERRGVVMFVMIVPSTFSRVGADGVRSARVNVLLASGRVSAARQEELLLDDVRHARADG